MLPTPLEIELREIYAANVRYFRKLRNLSQEQLADVAKLHRTFVGDVERGLKSPSFKSTWKLSSALQIDAAELFRARDVSIQDSAAVRNSTEFNDSEVELSGLFSRNLRRIRTESGLSQEALADLAGLHRTVVSQAERGLKSNSLAIVQKLSTALRVEPCRLFERAEQQRM